VLIIGAGEYPERARGISGANNPSLISVLQVRLDCCWATSSRRQAETTAESFGNTDKSQPRPGLPPPYSKKTRVPRSGRETGTLVSTGHSHVSRNA
jgi:hypothetical protein